MGIPAGRNLIAPATADPPPPYSEARLLAENPT
jgi:hypothetical protein